MRTLTRCNHVDTLYTLDVLSTPKNSKRVHVNVSTVYGELHTHTATILDEIIYQNIFRYTEIHEYIVHDTLCVLCTIHE